MFGSLIIGVGGIVLLMVGWVFIQSWWRDTFAENIMDDDVLAGRTKCSNCGCTTVCHRNDKQLTT